MASRAVEKAFKEVNEPDEIQLEFGLNFSKEVRAFCDDGGGGGVVQAIADLEERRQEFLDRFQFLRPL